MVILIISLIVLILIFRIGWTYNYQKSEIEYLDLYFEIVALIELPVTYKNYAVIHKKFISLSQMRYKNREKTTVLYEGFMRKFKSVAK